MFSKKWDFMYDNFLAILGLKSTRNIKNILIVTIQVKKFKKIHESNSEIWFPQEPITLANCPAVFLSYFSLWICYEIQPAVGTPYTAVQNVWTISPARNDQFESVFFARKACYICEDHPKVVSRCVTHHKWRQEPNLSEL